MASQEEMYQLAAGFIQNRLACDKAFRDQHSLQYLSHASKASAQLFALTTVANFSNTDEAAAAARRWNKAGLLESYKEK